MIESSTRVLDPVRGFISSMVSPVYLLAESPYLLSGALSDVVATQDQLLVRNQQLERQILELSQISQQYVALKSENDRLRGLLGSQGRLPYEVLIAELVGIVPDSNTFQIIIDKGSSAGVKPGLAVLDAQGLFGQVIEVGRFTSRVLLVNDPDHAVPVRVNRNGVRGIAGGTGEVDSLVLENVSVTADIVEGDLLETSGLGGRFPPGYPVGTVVSVVVEATSAYAQVLLRPTAALDRSRHVLVVFGPNPIQDPAVEAEQSQAQEEQPGQLPEPAL